MEIDLHSSQTEIILSKSFVSIGVFMMAPLLCICVTIINVAVTTSNSILTTDYDCTKINKGWPCSTSLFCSYFAQTQLVTQQTESVSIVSRLYVHIYRVHV